eukprot:SAG11_NODE_474_length_9142_cov_6.507907_3_plen_77_part_00
MYRYKRYSGISTCTKFSTKFSRILSYAILTICAHFIILTVKQLHIKGVSLLIIFLKVQIFLILKIQVQEVRNFYMY